MFLSNGTKFFEAVLLLSGMIIGVGMFGIPFSFAKVGFWPGAVELLLLATVVVLFHLLYGEIILRTAEPHRLPGYMKIYLGNRMGNFTFFVSLFSIVGSLLAYLLLGSIFFDNIARVWWTGSHPFYWVLFMVVAGIVFVRFPLGKEALINGILSASLIIFLIILSLLLLPGIRAEHFVGFNPSEILFPYGVLLFALSGGVAIPDVVVLLKRDRKKTRGAIVVGTLIPAVVYFLFALAVVGVSGTGVSEEALGGLRGIVGDNIIFLGSLIGFLAVFTSYIILSSNFESLLRLDRGMSGRLAWPIATLLPFFFYLAGFTNFLAIISIVGAVAGGIEAALIISAYHAMSGWARIRHPIVSYGWKIALFALLVTGIFYEIYKNI